MLKMKVRYIIFILSLIIIFSCNKSNETKQTYFQKDSVTEQKKQEEQNRQTDQKPGDTLKPNQTVIEAPPKMEYMFGQRYKKWTPSMNDIQTTEKLLYD